MGDVGFGNLGTHTNFGGGLERQLEFLRKDGSERGCCGIGSEAFE